MRPSPPNLRELFWVLLYPLGWAFAAIAWARRRILSGRGYRSTLPVVCVGNLHSGGSGKTPLVAAIAERFAKQSPVVLSRGYGARYSKSGARVDLTSIDGPANYGDEPWMLATQLRLPVYIARRRANGARAIERDRAGGFILLDDGFQHLGLARNLDLVAINALRSPNEGNTLPLGDLREPWSALSAADAVVLVRTDEDRGEDWKSFLEGRAKVFEARRIVEGLFEEGVPHEVDAGKRYAAFCALGRPDGFFADLTRLVTPVWAERFPDHHAYQPSELERLLERSRKDGIENLVTTEKDFPKVKTFAKPLSVRLLTLRIRYEMPNEFWYFLENRLGFSSGV